MIRLSSKLGLAFVLLIMCLTIVLYSSILPYVISSAVASATMVIEATVNTTNEVTNTAAITAKDQIDPFPTNNSASVILNEAGFVAETSIADIQDGDGVVVINTAIQRVKDPASGETIPTPIGCYQAKALYNPAGIQITTIRGGNPPFDSPVFNINNNEGSTTFTQYTIDGTIPSVTVAKLIPCLIGCASDSHQLQLTFDLIADPEGQQIPEETPHSLNFQRGDINGDGVVNIIDAMFGAQYLVGLRSIEDIHELNMASVKHDGIDGDMMNIIDCMYIAQYVVGLRDCYFISTTLPPTPTPTPTPTPGPVPATTIGNLTLVPTFKCISVYASFTGDTNANNNAVMQYKKSSDSTWETGMQMVVDRWATVDCTIDGVITNPFYDQWRCSIVGLDPNTSYDVRVTFTDANGVIGSNPVLGTVSTRNETIPVGSTAYYVAKTGSDSNDGSLADPWLTITYGLAHISAGQTLYVKAGNYSEYSLSIPSGTSWSALTSIINYGNDSVTISGNDSNSVFNINGHSYFRIAGLTIQHGGTAAIELHGCAHFVIENCSLGDCNLNHVAQYQAEIGVLDGSQDGVIRYIDFFATTGISSDWEYSAIRIDDSLGGFIVHDITWDDDHNVGEYFNDFFGNANSQLFHGGMFCDSDVYNINTIGGCNDNVLELKTAGVNVRVFDNKLLNSGDCFISTSPIMLGPLYIFRNEMWRTFDRYDCAFKEGSNGNNGQSNSLGYMFAYNNTVLHSGQAYGTWSGGDPVWRNHTYMNNIFCDMMSRGGAIYDSESAPAVLDYNCYNDPANIIWNDNVYATCADLWNASHEYEQHGINVADVLFASNAGYSDLHLQASSPCRNAGVIIQGFNDLGGPYRYSGSAPDIGALEYQETTPAPTPTATQPGGGGPPPTPTPTPMP